VHVASGLSAWGLDWDLDVQVPLIGGCATVRGEENADAVSSLGRPNVGLPGRGAAVCTELQNVVIRSCVSRLIFACNTGCTFFVPSRVTDMYYW
jgi:hypothetical protein